MNELIKKELESTFENVRITMPENSRLLVNAQKDQVMSILSFLKNKGYDHLALISCVDWIAEKEFEMVYITTSYLQDNDKYTDKEKIHITLKSRVSREEPKVISVIPVFENAEPYEREIHELFGIHFEGHPRLTPLFLEGKYEIPPFRKDFDTREYVKNTFDTIPFIEDKNT